MDAHLEVLEVRGLALVQDLGRPGHMHAGVPPGGALVPEVLVSAQRAVGNPAGLAGLECYGRLELRVRGRGAWVSMGAEAFRVEDGQSIMVPPPEHGVVRYMAVDGGLAVPEVLGGRGTLPVARVGGWEGRSLQAGDLVPLGPPSTVLGQPVPRPPWRGEARVVLGPELSRFGPDAVDTLLSQPFTVSATGNRVGMRLHGPSLSVKDSGEGLSAPMVRGAIQVPAGGEPIVLGPDHPTLGGYPVIAVVIRADQGSLAAPRPGDVVRFRAVSVDEARALWVPPTV
jgi:5-oxoprolinase (ATP-hydrolysing) subunit C